MTRVQISSGVKVVLIRSLLERFRQYLQSKMHSLLSKIFSNDTQRPSDEKLWQMPQDSVLPKDPFFPLRLELLEVHATSYFAASAKIFSFSCKDKSCVVISMIISFLQERLGVLAANRIYVLKIVTYFS